MSDRPISRSRWLGPLAVLGLILIGATPGVAQDSSVTRRAAAPAVAAPPGPGDAPPAESATLGVNVPASNPAPAEAPGLLDPGGARPLLQSAQTIGLFAVISMLPAALLMVSAFVRISIVLTLLRQALGTPQVPGNQVVLALSVLLTAIVMWPVGELVHDRAIAPFAAGELDAASAWQAGTTPLRDFMVAQIARAGHGRYVLTLWAYAEPERARSQAEPTYDMVSLRVLAPAFLLSELTTALFIGFAVYLPFLVVDLVVSAVLSAMGLFMLPPALVALPLKLVLFVLADGWMLVADMLLRSFGLPAGGV